MRLGFWIITSNRDCAAYGTSFAKPKASQYSTINALHKAYNNSLNLEIRKNSKPEMAVYFVPFFLQISSKQVKYTLVEGE